MCNRFQFLVAILCFARGEEGDKEKKSMDRWMEASAPMGTKEGRR
jgi:hypothetical protein